LYINTYVALAILLVAALVIAGLLAGYYGQVRDEFYERFNRGENEDT